MDFNKPLKKDLERIPKVPAKWKYRSGESVLRTFLQLNVLWSIVISLSYGIFQVKELLVLLIFLSLIPAVLMSTIILVKYLALLSSGYRIEYPEENVKALYPKPGDILYTLTIGGVLCIPTMILGSIILLMLLHLGPWVTFLPIVTIMVVSSAVFAIRRRNQKRLAVISKLMS